MEPTVDGADMAQPASASTMETAIARLNSLVLMERMDLVLPFMIGFAAQRRSINDIIPHFCRYCNPCGGVIYL